MTKPSHLAMLLLLGACTDSVGPDTVIDHGDGTYSLPAPAGVDATTTRQDGAITWRYVGQARHSWSALPVRSRTYVVAPDRPLTVEQQLLDGERVDADGSTWKPVAVDMEQVRAVIAANDARSIEVQRGLDRVDPAHPGTSTPREQVGERVTYQPHGWLRGDCDGSGGPFATDPDNHYFDNDDDRVAIDSTTSNRRRAMIELRLDGAEQCSGVILRQSWVLTSAHCVTDSNANKYGTSRLAVWRHDGVDSTPSYAVASTYVPSTYTANFDPKDDWALIKLATPLDAPYDDMDLSSASDSTLAALSHANNYAFPAFAPLCNLNLVGAGTAGDMYMNNSEGLGSIYSKKVNLKMDGGPGHSGSPVFYCPTSNNNECPGEEKGFVIALWTGWNGVETTMVGPKAASFRDAAVVYMDSH
jgi:V8-like Glu-specific endopeptidase